MLKADILSHNTNASEILTAAEQIAVSSTTDVKAKPFVSTEFTCHAKQAAKRLSIVRGAS